MADYKFTIIREFAIKISHALMIRSDANISEINSIILTLRCSRSANKPCSKISAPKTTIRFWNFIGSGRGCETIRKKYRNHGKQHIILYGLKIIEDDLQDTKKTSLVSLFITV